MSPVHAPVRAVALSRGRSLLGRVAPLLIVVSLVLIPPGWWIPGGLPPAPVGADTMRGTEHHRCPGAWKKSRAQKARVIRCWASERRIDGDRVIRIGLCESGPDLQDRYTADTHGGTFQHVVSYWPDRARAHGAAGYPIADVWAQAKVSTAMMAAGGWGHWSCT